MFQQIFYVVQNLDESKNKIIKNHSWMLSD